MRSSVCGKPRWRAQKSGAVITAGGGFASARCEVLTRPHTFSRSIVGLFLHRTGASGRPRDPPHSGSAVAGLYGTVPDNDTGRHGTGERASEEPELQLESRDILH